MASEKLPSSGTTLKIDDELLLISMFGKEISLGFVRLNVVEAIEEIKKLWT